MHVLELRNVSKRFADVQAVDDVSLSVPRGAFFALLGPSGCGKTTTLRLVAGFEQATGGDIVLNGERINDRKPYERNVSTVFQNYALFPHMTARANIEFGLRRRGATESEMARKVADVLALVQLAGKEERMPAQLSGGEKQRVALARSLVLAPDVLLLDEPLSALDPNLRQQVRVELRALQRRVGITFVFVTHDQEEALSLSDSMALMNGGRIEQAGTPQELYLRPRTRFAAGFLGAVNWVNGAGVRPQATRVSRERPAGETRSAAGVVEGAMFLGGSMRIDARLDSGERVTAEVPHSSNGFQPGDRVHVWWHAADEFRVGAG